MNEPKTKHISLVQTMNASSKYLDSTSNQAHTHPLKKYKAANMNILEEHDKQYNLPTFFTAN
jgi:hypothetical protein